MSCRFLSVYTSRSWSCIAKGSLRTTLSCGERVKACTSPFSSRTETSKSSKTTGTPVTAGPFGGVIVRVNCLPPPPPPPPRPPRPPPPRGKRKRPCSVAASYLAPIPFRSPEGEWQVLHLPAPLNHASPAFA